MTVSVGPKSLRLHIRGEREHCRTHLIAKHLSHQHVAFSFSKQLHSKKKPIIMVECPTWCPDLPVPCRSPGLARHSSCHTQHSMSRQVLIIIMQDVSRNQRLKQQNVALVITGSVSRWAQATPGWWTSSSTGPIAPVSIVVSQARLNCRLIPSQ